MKDIQRNIKTWHAIGREATRLVNALRKAMLDFCKKKRKTQRSLFIMNLIRRMECNVFAVILLAKFSLQRNGSVHLKLPVGLLLRNCFSDCILGLYVSKLPLNELKRYKMTLREEYVKSCLEMEEVYMDKIADLHLPNDVLENLYTLQLEDTFLPYLSIDEEWEVDQSKIPWKVKVSDKHITIKQMKEALVTDPSLSPVACKLYAYYKYFSQYEHFSDNGHGDSLADFGEDNVSYEKAINALEEGVELLLKKVFSSKVHYLK